MWSSLKQSANKAANSLNNYKAEMEQKYKESNLTQKMSDYYQEKVKSDSENKSKVDAQNSDDNDEQSVQESQNPKKSMFSFSFSNSNKKSEPERPMPATISRLQDPATAPNRMLRILLESAINGTKSDIPQHGINILNCLAQSHRIDIITLQELSFKGITDEVPGLRPVIWRILLGYLPPDTSQWDMVLVQQREQYESWKKELIVDTEAQFYRSDAQTREELKELELLKAKGDSELKRFYEDRDLWEEIEKDVKRTRVELAFFYMALDPTRVSRQDFFRLEMQSKNKKADLDEHDRAAYIESHSDALARVLFIYAQLNKGVRYVQGMNEVIAVLYYTFYKFGNEGVVSTQFLESDLFFCFTSLMQELKDGFLRDMDTADNGIQGKCKQVEKILEIVDPDVYNKLIEENVATQFYALRWLMLLMCQDFDMPNCVRLWDTLLADPDRFEFLNFVAASVILSARDTILNGDFAQIMECLQQQTRQYIDVATLVSDAFELKELHKKIISARRLAELGISVN